MQIYNVSMKKTAAVNCKQTRHAANQLSAIHGHRAIVWKKIRS